MSSKLSSNYYLQQIGGWSAILSGLFFLVVTIYIFSFLRMLGFDPVMMDDHTLLHPWVANYTRLYRLSWILFFLTQFFLLPVPHVLAHYFANGHEKQKALAQLSKTFGITAISIAVLSPVIFYAASPITARAYVEVSDSVPIQNISSFQNLVLMVSTLMTDIPKEIRLFSELFLSVWLILVGFLFRRTGRSQAVGWLTFIVGCWTLSIVSIKIFYPENPLEDFLGFVLAVTYAAMGVHLLRDRA